MRCRGTTRQFGLQCRGLRRAFGDDIRIGKWSVVRFVVQRVCEREDVTTRFINELRVGMANAWEVPGYWVELMRFGCIEVPGSAIRKSFSTRRKVVPI